MKKRKFNILLNIAVLCMCVAAIAIGVYSAKTASLNVSGTIGFNAHNCNVSATCSIEGAIDENMQVVTKEETISSIDGKTFDFGKIYFDDYNQDYTKAITLNFKLKNNSNFPVMISVDAPTSDNIYCSSSVIFLEENSNEYDYSIDLMNKTYDNFTVSNYNLRLVATKTTLVEENETDGWYGSVTDGKYTITQLPTLANNNNSTELIIPNIIKQTDGTIVPVVNVKRADGYPTSMTNLNLYTKVTIAYGLESASLAGADGNSSVTELVLPKPFKSVPGSGFKALKSVTLQASEGTLNISETIDDLFVPNGVTAISYTSAKKIHIPDSVTKIESLRGLEQTPNIPNSVTTIAGLAGTFSTITLPNSVTTIAGLAGTFSTITLPNELKEVGGINSDNLTSIIIPNSVTTILNSASAGSFGGSSFEKIYIPSGVTIGLFSFTTKNASTFKIYTSESSYPSYWETSLAKNNYNIIYNSSLEDFNAG